VRTPVIMLSALGDVDARICGLRAGGDDYLTKPFDPDELIARLEAMLRRGTKSIDFQETKLRVGSLEIDLLARSVKREGQEIELQPTEYRVLEFMTRHAGRTITRSMLFEAIWGYHFNPGTNLINVHIARLRKKIERDGEPPLIQTVRGSGYVLG
jgi:two-component system OmpR family response regulator